MAAFLTDNHSQNPNVHKKLAIAWLARENSKPTMSAKNRSITKIFIHQDCRISLFLIYRWISSLFLQLHFTGVNNERLCYLYTLYISLVFFSSICNGWLIATWNSFVLHFSFCLIALISIISDNALSFRWYFSASG